MIILFIIDLLINKIFNCSSYLLISYIPFLKRNNIMAFFTLIIFIDLYLLSSIFNVIIISIIIIFNTIFLVNLNKKSKILIDYLLYFFILQLSFNALRLDKFMIIIFFTFIEIHIIYHILPKFHIKLFRW